MFRSTLIAVLALATLSVQPTTAQVRSDPGIDRPVNRSLTRLELSGPRFGFTSFTGDVSRLRQSVGKSPVMSQFGWQFETQILSSDSGNQALLEWVFLLGGVEQDELNLSLSWLAGYRLPNGLEFGVGPNVSAAKDRDDLQTSMVLAAGATVPFGDMRVPFNLAVALAEGGPRITTLLGWIIG